MRSTAILLIVHLVNSVLGRQQFSYKSFCHEPNWDLVQYKYTTPEEDANEWCVIILEHDKSGYWKQIRSPSDITPGRFVLNMTKLRALCESFDFTLVNLELKHGPDSSLKQAIRKAMYLYDVDVKSPDDQYFPIDCACKSNPTDFENKNDLVLTCEKGTLPDDYEHYYAYVPRNTTLPPGYAKIDKKATWDEDNHFDRHHFVCYQKVQTVYPAPRTTATSIRTSRWMIFTAMLLSGLIE